MIEILAPEVALPAALQLYPYQQRWIDDPARFLCAVKSARIGFSYATGLRAIFKCLGRPNYTRTVLSASKAQSIEFVETCRKNIQLMGAVAEAGQELYADELGATDVLVEKITFANGSRIMALPANPRTARGYPGDVTLDEFAHVQDSYAIWAAAIRQTTLGNSLEVLSTPNGEQGKFFDIASDLGLTDGVAPLVNPVRKGPWSGHWIDLAAAIRQGLKDINGNPVDAEEMRIGVGDNDTWRQEFCCEFLKAQGAWLPMDLIANAEDDDAGGDRVSFTVRAGSASGMNSLPMLKPRGELYLGIDVGRERDATCLWLDEKIGDVLWCRAVLWLNLMSFVDQAEVLAPFLERCDRAAIDSTGMGIGLYDILAEKFRSKLMGVNFSGSTRREDAPSSGSGREVADSIKLKVKLAIDLKSSLERSRSRLPRDGRVRSELMAIKREATATGVKFDAPRLDVGTAVAGGAKKKQTSHAEAFWAKSLAVFASQGSSLSVGFEGGRTQSIFAGSSRYM